MTHEEIEAAIGRIEKLSEEKAYLAYDVMRALIGRDFPDLYNNIGMLIDLLKQADPDTHMELPVDADGVPIHVGDELCGHYYPDGGVYCVSINGSEAIFVSKIGQHYKDAMLWKPSDCRHYHKPTVEDLLREFGDEVQRCCDTEDTIAEYAEKIREAMA